MLNLVRWLVGWLVDWLVCTYNFPIFRFHSLLNQLAASCGSLDSVTKFNIDYLLQVNYLIVFRGVYFVLKSSSHPTPPSPENQFSPTFSIF